MTSRAVSSRTTQGRHILRFACTHITYKSHYPSVVTIVNNSRSRRWTSLLPGTVYPGKNCSSCSMSLFTILRGSFARMASKRLVLFCSSRSHTLCLKYVDTLSGFDMTLHKAYSPLRNFTSWYLPTWDGQNDWAFSSKWLRFDWDFSSLLRGLDNLAMGPKQHHLYSKPEYINSQHA